MAYGHRDLAAWVNRQHGTISGEGHVVAFTDENHQIVARDLSGELELVSVNSSGDPANGLSGNPTLSSDGRFVAFESQATNLVVGDSNGVQDVFVHDRSTGVTTLVSVDSMGMPFTTGSGVPDISADGRFVTFGRGSLWLHDRQTGVSTAAIPSAPGCDLFSRDHALSANGRYIAICTPTNLVPEATGTAPKIYRHDRVAGTTELVTIDTSGDVASGRHPSISADGRYVAFRSSDDDLVAGDDGHDDLFRRDMDTGTTVNVPMDHAAITLLSVASDPAVLSDNGRYIVYSVNVSPSGLLSPLQVFHFDFDGGDTTVVSIDEGGGPQDFLTTPVVRDISADGRYVVFHRIDINIDDEQKTEIMVVTAPTIDITGTNRGPVARSSSAQLVINGTNLDEVVSLNGDPGVGLTFSDLVVTENQVQATVTAASDAELGLHDLALTVSTPGPGTDGQTSTTKTCFRCVTVLDAG